MSPTRSGRPARPAGPARRRSTRPASGSPPDRAEDATFFESAATFRRWLATHHARVALLWVGFHTVDSGVASIRYPEALDEALCFGWIDGLRERLDPVRYLIRFTPRRAGSVWSKVNTRRANELIRLGRMRAAGAKAFEARDVEKTGSYSFERDHVAFDRACERSFRAARVAWKFFEAQPPGYRRAATWWVMSAKRDETRSRRLAKLIADSAAGKRLDMLTSSAKRKS